MYKRNIPSTVKRLVTVIALSLLPLIGKADEDAQPAAACPMTSSGGQSDVGEQPFENLQARTQHFAEELGRLKGEGLTISSEQLVEQANAEKTYRVETQAGSNEKLSPETVYARSRSGVVVLGGIFKCNKCQQWHAQCASGFVVGKDGLILTNLHVVESFKKLEATGAMTDDGRVFPLKAVLAANRLNDLALLKLDADNLQPLPVAKDISVGAAVYCLSHPVLSEGKINCFYTFTSGTVSGKFSIHNEKQQMMKVLAVTAEYGPGSSGGPILNEQGAVVAVACQVIPLMKKDHDKEVTSMVWRFARPSCDILSLLTQPETDREATGKNVP